MNLVQHRNIFFLIVFFFFAFHSKAQKSNTLYFLDNVPAASFLNPAFSPENDFVIGLPFISGLIFRTRVIISFTGFIVPNTFETYVNASSFVFLEIIFSRLSGLTFFSFEFSNAFGASKKSRSFSLLASWLCKYSSYAISR